MGFKGLPKKNAAPLEADIQRAVVAWLEAVGCLVVRVNSGGMPWQDARGNRRVMRFNGSPGCSDLLVCLPAACGSRFVALEIKRPGGPGPTDLQRAFLSRVTAAGGLALVARSVQDVEQALALEGFRVVRGRLTREGRGGD